MPVVERFIEIEFCVLYVKFEISCEMYIFINYELAQSLTIILV